MDHVISSTVIAADPATAGALATAFSVLTVDESRNLAATLPGVEYLLVERNGRRVESAGWRRFEAPQSRLAAGFAAKPAPAPAPQAGNAAAWDPSMELTVHLELARLDNMRALARTWPPGSRTRTNSRSALSLYGSTRRAGCLSCAPGTVTSVCGPWRKATTSPRRSPAPRARRANTR